MNDEERRETAEKLVDAIKHNTNGAYDKWTSSDLKEPASRAAFVQSATGLTTPPSTEDMKAMQTHITRNLRADVDEIQKTKPPGEHAVGFACISEDH